LPAALFTASTTPFPLLLVLLRLAVERDELVRFFAALELGLRPLLEARERLVDFAAGLRLVDFLVLLERFVLLLRGVLAAIESSLSGVQIRSPRPTRSAS
jgi:hypothetical protein